MSSETLVVHRTCHHQQSLEGKTEVDELSGDGTIAAVDVSTLQQRAADAMDHMWNKACEKGEEAERYMIHTWQAWTPCHFHHLPHWLQDNDYLMTGHRPPLESYKACFYSLFRLHTETANIWTHLIGTLIFAGLAVYVLLLEKPYPLNWEDRVVFGTFFLCAITCLGLSSTYHTLSCHSPQVGRFFSRLDYCGIALLITGSFVPFLYYGFWCEYVPKVGYLILVCVLGVLTIIVSLWEKFSEPSYRPLRASVFMSFGLSGVIPGMHWLLTQDDLRDSLKYSFGCLILMGILYVTGALLYALRIPERFFPGKCDVWFHSHQLFHVLVIAAAIVHYQGISEMAMYRLTSSDAVCPADTTIAQSSSSPTFDL